MTDDPALAAIRARDAARRFEGVLYVEDGDDPFPALEDRAALLAMIDAERAKVARLHQSLELLINDPKFVKAWPLTAVAVRELLDDTAPP